MSLDIKIGIKTAGEPILKSAKGYTYLENMLIGDGFHWEKVIPVKLPGKVIPLNPKGTAQPTSIEPTSANKNISLINILPLETYVECVVGSEMNPDAPVEFQKAHAVISRNWVLGKILALHDESTTGSKNDTSIIVGWDDTAGHSDFDVCSDDHCQRYQGLQNISQLTSHAIRFTKNQVLLDPDNHLIDTRFSKCCGGQTEVFSTCWQPFEKNCLKSFPDPWCDLTDLQPSTRQLLLNTFLKKYDTETLNYGFRWENEVKKSDIKRNLKLHFNREIGDIDTLKVLHRGPSGRIDLLEIKGSKATLVLGKELWIRRLLSSSHLYSSAFEIVDLGETVKLKGRGWGHGVGLCQIGAANMATRNYDYKSILNFYYPGSSLHDLSEIANI